MICQACGKNTATTHIKTTVNGKLTEIYLCPDCAREQGYAHLFDDWGFSSLMSGLLGAAAPQRQVQKCPSCGQSFEEISRSGKIGCDPAGAWYSTAQGQGSWGFGVTGY